MSDARRIDDIVTVAKGSPDDAIVSTLVNLPDGTFSPPQKGWIPPEDAVTLFWDFNGDRRSDAAAVCYSVNAVGKLWIRSNLGDGHFGGGGFEEETPVLATVNYPRSLAHGDFDGDGRVDLAVGCIGLYTEGSFTVLFHSAITPTVGVSRANSARHVPLTLESIAPNPSTGILRARFTLPTPEPARLELLDVTGRRVHTESLAIPSPGVHSRVVAAPPRQPPGIYWVRLVQGVRSASRKVVITR
jgi:hypothetical protein